MLDLLERNSPALMQLISPALAEELHKASVTVKYDDGQSIHSRGDNKPGVSIVKSGAARIGTLGMDGSFITVSVLGVGQSFGEHTLFADLPRTHDVSAVGPTEIDQIPGPVFMRLFDEQRELAPALLKTALARSYAFLEQLDDMRRLALHVRLAKFLMSIGVANQQAEAVIKCLQSELAFTLGVSRVAIGKAVKRLHAAGLIEPGYGQITLRDRARLKRWIDAEIKIVPLQSGRP